MSTQKEGKLLDEVCDFMRLHHFSIHTERTYCDWIKKYVQALLGHSDVSTTMIYTHVLQKEGYGVPSPLDDLDLASENG